MKHANINLENKQLWVVLILFYTVILIYINFRMIPIANHLKSLVTGKTSPDIISTGLFNTIKFISWVLIPIILLIKIVIITSIIYLVLIVLERERKFIEIINLVVLVESVQTISSVYNAIIILDKGFDKIHSIQDLEINVGINNFLYLDKNSIFYYLSSKIDIFQIAYFAILYLSLTKLFKITPKKSIIAPILLFLLYISFIIILYSFLY